MDSQSASTNGDQLMSLITIDKNGNKDSTKPDLLTLRILESSERKMNLLKELLTPDQYRSVKSNLDERDLESNQILNFKSHRSEDKPKVDSSSLPANQDQAFGDEPSVQELSKSATDLRFLSRELNSNLLRKREANDFFFNSRADVSKSSLDQNISFELRSGRSRDLANTSVGSTILFESKLTWTTVFCGFLNLIRTHESAGPEDIEELSVTNLKRFTDMGLYSSQNMKTLIDRLKADGDLEKVKQLEFNEPTNDIETNRVPSQTSNLNRPSDATPDFAQSVGGSDFLSNSSGILVEPVLPDSLVPFTCALSSTNTVETDDKMKLTIESLKIIKHSLLSEEEKQILQIRNWAVACTDLKSSLKEICDQTVYELSNISEAELISRMSQIQQICEDLCSNQEKLRNLYASDESKSGEYSQTTLTNILEPLNGALDRIMMHNGVEKFEAYRKFSTCIKELQQRPVLDNIKIQKIQLDQDRRSRIASSLSKLYLLIKTRRTEVKSKLSINEDDLMDLDRIKLTGKIIELPRADNLELSLVGPMFSFLPILRACLSSCKSRVVNQKATFSLNTSWIELEIVAKTVETKPASEPVENRLSDVELLYSFLFKLKHSMYDWTTKVNKIFNRFDPFILASLLQKKSTHQQLTGDRFILDPLAVKINLNDLKRDNSRINLLLSRWINRTNHIVYLSSHENKKLQTLQQINDTSSMLTKKVDRLTSVDTTSPTLSYKRVEFRRKIAADYLQGFNIELERLCSSTRLKPTASSLEENYGYKILEEPELKLTSLGTVARAAYRFKPKRIVNRPLLPRRKLQSQKLSYRNRDIESQTDRIHRLVSTRNNLQLVVTVQKASHVPMRIDQNHKQSTIRPVSPLLSPLGQVGFNQTSRISVLPSSPIPPSTYLTSPTTYVELVFRRRQLATSLASGTEPIWNETLFIPVDLDQTNNPLQDLEGNDVYHKARQLFHESLQLNLYDYNSYLHESADNNSYSNQATIRITDPQSSTLSTSEGPRSVMMSKQHIERHLLGSLRVPLSTLLAKGRIEGTFSLSQPLLLENYQYEQTVSTSQAKVELSDEMNPKQQETLVSVFIALDPQILINRQYFERRSSRLESMEREDIRELAEIWEDFMSYNWNRATLARSTLGSATNQPSATSSRRRLNQAQRYVRALVVGKNFCYKLIYRYLFPLKPPESLMANEHVMRRLARFVYLLDPIKNGHLTLNSLASSVWFDSQQLVEQSLGGIEEKAVLLCNYFLYLGKCSALLLGDSITDGRTVYVLVWDHSDSIHLEELVPRVDNGIQIKTAEEDATPTTYHNFLSRLPIIISARNVQIWSVSSGKSYSPKDLSSLIGIGSIVTVENVYANIQADVDWFHQTNFDIRMRQYWAPLFDASPDAITGIRSDARMRQNLFRSFHESGGNPAGWRQQRRRIEALQRSIGKPDLLEHEANKPDLPLAYGSFNDEQCRHMESVIERTIKRYLLNWRPNKPTYFNRTLSKLVASKLSTFEKILETSPSDEDAWRAELVGIIRREVLLSQISSSAQRQVVSWPANLTYSSMKVLLDSLFASGVHDADFTFDLSDLHGSSNSTQFIVSCHVYPYPAETLSLWLYVAAIVVNSNHANQALEESPFSSRIQHQSRLTPS